MVTATTLTPRGLSLAKTLQAAFAALADHAKAHPAEYATLMDAAAAHVRSAAPLAMLKPLAPLTSVKVPIADGWYGLTAIGTGVVLVVNEGRRDAALTLTPVQVEALCRDAMAVSACVEGGGTWVSE